VRWAGIGCLVFAVAPISTCAMCVAIDGPEKPEFKINQDDATGLSLDLSSLTDHGDGATISSRDGDVHVKLPSLGDPGANMLLENFARALIDGDERAVERLQRRFSEELTDDEKTALKVAEKLAEKLDESDAGAAAARLRQIAEVRGAPTSDAGPLEAVTEGADAGLPTAKSAAKPPRSARERRAAKRAAKKAKKAKAGAARRDEIAARLAAEEAAREAKKAKAKAKAKKSSKTRHPGDRFLDGLRNMGRKKGGD